MLLVCIAKDKIRVDLHNGKDNPHCVLSAYYQPTLHGWIGWFFAANEANSHYHCFIIVN